jgi:hypothetical protein
MKKAALLFRFCRGEEKVMNANTHSLLWSSPWLLLTALAIGCAPPSEEGPFEDPAEVESEPQELRYGSFSFLDPAVGQLSTTDGGCTATLIDPRAVVTAAHCVGYRTGAVSGTFRIDLGPSASDRRSYSVQEARSYGDGVGKDDVAIVRLTSAVPASVAVPLAISCAGALSNGVRVTMYGYGCRNTQGDSYAGRKQRFVTDFDQTIYSCPGDSGGPVISPLGDRRVISLVFSGKIRHWPWDWNAAYGLVYRHATAVDMQADVWAGRSPEAPRCSGGGGGGSDDPPRHEN